MTRIEGWVIVAGWLVMSSTVALVRLAARFDAVVAHPAGARAAVGPLLVALSSLFAAWRLRRGGRAIPLAGVLLGVQVVALSAGPMACRLDVGPFVRVGFGESGPIAAIGSDARLLLILGSLNRVPPGVAINLLPLAALIVSWQRRARPLGPPRRRCRDFRPSWTSQRLPLSRGV